MNQAQPAVSRVSAEVYPRLALRPKSKKAAKFDSPHDPMFDEDISQRAGVAANFGDRRVGQILKVNSDHTKFQQPVVISSLQKDLATVCGGVLALFQDFQFQRTTGEFSQPNGHMLFVGKQLPRNRGHFLRVYQSGMLVRKKAGRAIDRSQQIGQRGVGRDRSVGSVLHHKQIVAGSAS